MNIRILLLAPAFLIAVALLRPSADVATPPRAPKLEAAAVKESALERPSLLDALVRFLPRPSTPASEPGLIGELVRTGSQNFHPTIRTKVIERVAELLELAYLLFRRERYPQCMTVCDRILLLVPNYDPALEIRNVAARLCHATVSDLSPLLKWIEGLAEETDDSSIDPRVPEMNRIEIPDAVAGSILLEVVGPVFEKEHPVKTDPGPAEIRRKLETEKVDLVFRDCRTEDALAYLREITGLNILLDSECRDVVDLDRRTDLVVREMVLSHALRLLLAPHGLEAVVTEEHVVLLTAPHRVAAFAAKN